MKVVDFVQRVITRMGLKGYLYPGAIRAILRSPASPRSQLRHFEKLIEPSSPNNKLKFAMIGDRQTKDMQPPAELLGKHIVTIRLHSLGYAVDEEEKAADRKADPPPQFLADTLAQAKAILLHKDTWKFIQCTSDPPIFNCKVEVSPADFYPEKGDTEVSRIGLDYIICGCKIAYRMTRRICAGILVEHLVQSEEKARQAVLAPYLSPGSATRPPVAERATLLCAGASRFVAPRRSGFVPSAAGAGNRRRRQRNPQPSPHGSF